MQHRGDVVHGYFSSRYELSLSWLTVYLLLLSLLAKLALALVIVRYVYGLSLTLTANTAL